MPPPSGGGRRPREQASPGSRVTTLSPRRAFLRALRARAARIAITSSSMRGKGVSAAITVMREQCLTLDLRRFGIPSEDAFVAALDDATDAALSALPPICRFWGLARKGLNIYLRECLYTHYLRQAYYLNLTEEYFELPLDKWTGTRLHAFDRSVPPWASVRGLTPEESAAYQEAATRAATTRGLARVHLDAFWWGLREES